MSLEFFSLHRATILDGSVAPCSLHGDCVVDAVRIHDVPRRCVSSRCRKSWKKTTVLRKNELMKWKHRLFSVLPFVAWVLESGQPPERLSSGYRRRTTSRTWLTKDRLSVVVETEEGEVDEAKTASEIWLSPHGSSEEIWR